MVSYLLSRLVVLPAFMLATATMNSSYAENVRVGPIVSKATASAVDSAPVVGNQGNSYINFSKLPFSDSIIITRGAGTRKLAVFADPHCGYCKSFEPVLEALEDSTVYLFLFPILGEQSLATSIEVWCSANPAQAWRNLMLQRARPAATKKNCHSTPVNRNLFLGNSLNLRGTPALVFEDGSSYVRSMSAQELESKLVSIYGPLRQRTPPERISSPAASSPSVSVPQNKRGPTPTATLLK